LVQKLKSSEQQAPAVAQNDIVFGPFRLNAVNRQLICAGQPVKLSNRALDILCELAAAGGDVVNKDRLMERVWAGRVVEENAIQVHVSALRKALDAGGGGQSYIMTVPGRGYRLVGVAPPSAGASVIANNGVRKTSPERPSIVVLPFQNMSSDSEQDYFSDGIVEDIITGLSRIKWLSVIARNSSFVYKNKAIDLRQVGRELDVLYVLEGSVRKSGNQIRMTAKLAETTNGTQIWAERYDRRLDDIFAVQDEIAMSVVGSIEPGLQKVEVERVKRKRPDSLDAYDLVLQALPYLQKLMPQGSAAAIPLLKNALQLEPDYPFALAALAWCYHIRFGRGGLHEDDRQTAIQYARAALTGAADDATTLAISAFVIWFEARDTKTAFELFDRALAISGSNFLALSTSAVSLAWSGQCELAIERANRALRLSPFDSLGHLAYQGLAGANFQLKRFAEAHDAARRAIELNPAFSVPYLYLTASLVGLRRLDDAKTAAATVLSLDPDFTIRRFSATVGVNPSGFLAFANAWRQAGLPA
jgi:TolB-like protein/Flp pilus assembly protein TadD